MHASRYYGWLSNACCFDHSKVVQGILLASSRSLVSREQLAHLWLHESCRVFHDRLTCEEDRGQFKDMLVRGSGRFCEDREALVVAQTWRHRERPGVIG